MKQKKQTSTHNTYSYKKSILLLITIFFAGLFLSACMSSSPQTPNNPDITYFSSSQELQAFLEEQTSSSANNFARDSGMRALSGTMDMAVAESDSAPSSAPSTSAGSGQEPDFSTTNVQVEGIDEADIVKTNGEEVFILSTNTLTILDANRENPEQASTLSETTISGNPQSMFLEGNQLVVFTQTYEEEMHWPEYSMVPIPRSRTITQALIYDITNKEDPQLEDTITTTGSYTQARLVGDKVYLITHESPFYGGPVPMPRISSDSQAITPRVGHLGNYEEDYQYTTLAQFSTSGEDLLAETYLTGYSNTVYMSHEAIYVAHQKSVPWRTEQREQFFEVVVPELPGTLRSKIQGIDTRNIDEEEKWTLISEELTRYVNDLSENEQERFYEDIEEAIREYERAQALERSQTIIHKFSLDLEHLAQTQIAGTLLNQFSLDEHDNHLRVATSVNAWTRNDRVQYSNVYVLNQDLEEVGLIENIAPDERIFSTRFIGERLYMVTFEQVDPFFVIDLANPSNPQILGELKIPGWSDYLHPYDENHIIGLGRQTSLSSAGGVRVEGVKLSLFNVEDVSNPREVDVYEVGGAGSHSEALYDHKAFLFDKEKELLVLPVVEMTSGYRYSWDGAYVFKVTTNGFERQARIAHRDTTQDWWARTSSVRRALYIDDTLYTISKEQVRLHSLTTLEPITSIRLTTNEQDYDRPHPMPEPMPVDSRGQTDGVESPTIAR